MVDSTASLDPLAALLRDEETLISSLVRDPRDEPVLGVLAAAGPRAADAPGDYLLLIEAIREGYLLHYGSPRLIDAADPDLRLLAGDFLYALGLERLAAHGDLEAVRELADLISLSAQLHAGGGGDEEAPTAKILWLASATAVGAGGNRAHEKAKEVLRSGGDGATELLAAAASEMALEAGIQDALARASEAIGFAAEHLSDRG